MKAKVGYQRSGDVYLWQAAIISDSGTIISRMVSRQDCFLSVEEASKDVEITFNLLGINYESI